MATVSFRTDPETERALAELTADGATHSDAVRRALIETARRHRSERLRQESEALVNDPVDRAEVAAIQSELETMRAW